MSNTNEPMPARMPHSGIAPPERNPIPESLRGSRKLALLSQGYLVCGPTFTRFIESEAQIQPEIAALVAKHNASREEDIDADDIYVMEIFSKAWRHVGIRVDIDGRPGISKEDWDERFEQLQAHTP